MPFSNNRNLNFRFHQHLRFQQYIISPCLNRHLYRLASLVLNLHLGSQLTNTLRWNKRLGHAHPQTHLTHRKTREGRCRWTALNPRFRGKQRSRRRGHLRRQAVILSPQQVLILGLQHPPPPHPRMSDQTRMMHTYIHSMLTNLMVAMFFAVNFITLKLKLLSQHIHSRELTHTSVLQRLSMHLSLWTLTLQLLPTQSTLRRRGKAVANSHQNPVNEKPTAG